MRFRENRIANAQEAKRRLETAIHLRGVYADMLRSADRRIERLTETYLCAIAGLENEGEKEQ